MPPRVKIQWSATRCQHALKSTYVQIADTECSRGSGGGGGLTTRSVFFAPVVLICIISVIIYYLAGEDLPIGPRALGNEVPTFYFVLQSQLIGTDCYLLSESRKEQGGDGEKTDVLLIPRLAYSYVFPWISRGTTSLFSRLRERETLER